MSGITLKSIPALCYLAATLSLAQPSAAAASNALYSGGDGSDCEKAVVVNTDDRRKGVAAEYQWLNDNHPGGQRGRQAVGRDAKGRVFDHIEWIKPDGSSISVCFDVTRFFGKP